MLTDRPLKVRAHIKYTVVIHFKAYTNYSSTIYRNTDKFMHNLQYTSKGRPGMGPVGHWQWEPRLTELLENGAILRRQNYARPR